MIEKNEIDLKKIEAAIAEQLATKTDLAEAKTEIIKWAVGSIFVAVGLFATIMKVIH